MRVLFYPGIKLGKISCKILGSHIIFAEDSNLLVFYTMLVGKNLPVRIIGRCQASVCECVSSVST